jgi:4-hydroxy-3-polyprenylbenzoate decarboxylase
MGYKSLEQCLLHLEQNNHLIRINEEVDTNLLMSAIQMRVYENQGPAILFENVKNCKFRCVSNIFGTVERSKFIFKDTLQAIEQLIYLKFNPIEAIKNPFTYFNTLLVGAKSLPRKRSNHSNFVKGSISDLPHIINWPNDGGAFITLPQVYSEDIDKPGIMNSNIGMYRIQISGNSYIKDKTIGLHYQLHRGIGVHQQKSNFKNKALKVSIFVGGPPSHSLAAVMPLPEGISEVTFAGALNNNRFSYSYTQNGECISNQADFVITGYVNPNENAPEGPFGDHLGYYSLTHDFPLMHVTGVYYKPNAIWPFTVVGRPPQEDTSFGALIHSIAGKAIPNEINGVMNVHAVDAAGVHPLLFAIGTERYTPYSTIQRPQEILTQANHILGKGQLSLAKFLFISNHFDNTSLNIYNEIEFLIHIFERINFERDLHFYTNTSIDTLDYSGDGLNTGSKVVFAAVGNPIRKLCTLVPNFINEKGLEKTKLIMPGVIAIETSNFISYENTHEYLKHLNSKFTDTNCSEIVLFILCDNASFISENTNNFLWTTFTKVNPSHDIHGINSYTINKHWACKGPLVIDARTKPHHAPALEMPQEIQKQVEALATKGKSLHGII